MLFTALSLQVNAQNIGGIGVPFDPLKLIPKTDQQLSDSLSKRIIEIVHSDFLIQETDTSTNTIKRILNGRVKLIHDGAIMTCDSAILYPQRNYLEAIGKVKIIKGDSVDVRSDILKYDGNSKISVLENNAQLRDRGSILTAPMMTYELDKDIGHFWNHGKLVSDSTTLTSSMGTHFQKEGIAVFRGDVVLVSPDYTMTADSMRYDTEKKIAYFIAPTTIVSGNDTIITEDGYFDTQLNKAFLKGRPLIKNGDKNTLQSDHLDYDKSKGIGIAQGNVISKNIKEQATLLSNHIYYIDSIKYTKATQDPLLIKEDKKDTLYLSADTLINFTVPISQFIQSDSLDIDSLSQDSLAKDSTFNDSLSYLIIADSLTEKEVPKLIDTLSKIDTSSKISIDILHDESLKMDSISAVNVTDSTNIDSVSISNEADSVKVFYGYRNVKLIRTNLSGVCDSIYFNSQDSIFRLYYNPILWMDSTQMKADSIYIFMKNEEAERIELYNNAIIINESAPGVYNQISGKKITGWLIDNDLRHVLVDGNAECIYFLKNDSNQYLGGNHAKSALINISFKEENEIERIKLEISPEAIFTPIQMIQHPTYRLDNFSWFWSYKPKSKWDVIRDTTQYQNYIATHPLPLDSTVQNAENISDTTDIQNTENVEIQTVPVDEIDENTTNSLEKDSEEIQKPSSIIEKPKRIRKTK